MTHDHFPPRDGNAEWRAKWVGTRRWWNACRLDFGLSVMHFLTATAAAAAAPSYYFLTDRWLCQLLWCVMMLLLLLLVLHFLIYLVGEFLILLRPMHRPRQSPPQPCTHGLLLRAKENSLIPNALSVYKIGNFIPRHVVKKMLSATTAATTVPQGGNCCRLKKWRLIHVHISPPQDPRSCWWRVQFSTWRTYRARVDFHLICVRYGC